MTKSTHPLIAELEAYHEMFQKRAKIALSAEFTAFFDKFPEVDHCKWAQYTPYFNDGEPCEFGVCSISAHAKVEHVGTVRAPAVKVIGEIEPDVAGIIESAGASSDYDLFDAIDEACYNWRTREELRARTARERALKDAVTQITILIGGLGDMMKAIFGDHVIITANRDGFDVEEYDHD